MADTKEVKALKKQIAELTEANEALKANCESAYEQARVRNQQLDELLAKINNDMSYIQKQTASFCETIARVTKGVQ